jgi:regulatory subunit for Cdc7p protein kinase
MWRVSEYRPAPVSQLKTDFLYYIELQRVLERLMSDDSNPEAILRDYGAVDHSVHMAAGHAFNLQMNGNAPKQSLPSLLRAEAVSGSTYERDLSTFRPDFFYFNPKNGYILVEDSSGEYQPAHAKEYTQRIHLKPGEESDRDTEWPTLWGGQEGRQAFYKPSATHKPPFPSRELIEANARGPEPVLTRSHKKPIVREPAIPEPASYLAASGNSQIITSNIQSGTSTRSGQVLGANAGKAAGNSLANGYIINKHLARLGSKNAHVVTLGSAKAATSSNAQHSAYVVEIAERAKASLMKRSVSLDTGLSLKQMPVAKPPRPEPKKPGYCENCRVRFDDFKSVSVFPLLLKCSIAPKQILMHVFCLF